MLTEQQRQRFRALQQSELDGTLAPTEQSELQALARQIEAEEAEYLRPATEHIHQERLQIQEQNRALQLLIRRKERLARRLERVLALSASERQKINTQVKAILDGGSARSAK